MSVTASGYRHIVLDAAGVPFIHGTTMKVVELVMERDAFGWSPEALLIQHPYLTLGQIHSALAYYWDHKETLDADVKQRQAFVDRMQAAADPSPLVQRLRAAGHLKR